MSTPPTDAPQVLRTSRKRADNRIHDLVEATDALILRTRSAEISLQDVAKEVGISRALVYAYFPDRYRLLDAVLDRHLKWLDIAGLPKAATTGGFAARIENCARIMFHHVIDRGATLDLVMRERDVARQLDGSAARYLRRILITLARRAAVELHMGNMEAMAFVELLAVIPLEAARRVQTDSIDPKIAEAICLRLVHASIRAQVPVQSQ